MRKMRSFVVILVMIILGLSFPVLNACSIENEIDRDVLGPLVGEPEIDIQIAPGNHRAYVEPGQSGIVTVTGTVFCEIPWDPNVQYLVVTLRGDAGEWPTSNPPSLTFSKAQKQQSFTMSVQVPIETPPDESRDLVITGTWQYSPGTQSGNTETEYVYIEVMPYAYLDMDWDAGNTTLFIGETESFEVEIINQGTMAANVNLACHSDSGDVEIELNKGYLQIPAHQREKVTVKFGQPSGSQRIHKITFSAEDIENSRQGPVQRSFTLFTKEKTVTDRLGQYLIPGVIIIGLILVLIIFFVIYRKRKG